MPSGIQCDQFPVELHPETCMPQKCVERKFRTPYERYDQHCWAPGVGIKNPGWCKHRSAISEGRVDVWAWPVWLEGLWWPKGSRQLDHVIVWPLSVIFGKSCRSRNITGDGKKAHVIPTYKKSLKEIQENMETSILYQPLGRLRNESSWGLSHVRWSTWLGEASMDSPRANCAWQTWLPSLTQ